MRIAIFTEKDYTFMLTEWAKLVAELQRAGHTVVGLYLFPTKLGKNTGRQISLYYLRTFGLWVFLKLGFTAAATRLKQIINSLFQSQSFTYRQLAQQSGINLKFGQNPNDPEVVNWIKENNLDVVIISFGFIVKQPFIEAARVAVINKHSALLPAFRGLFPVFWALESGSPVGVTVHKVDAGVDTGEILYQKIYNHPEFKSVFQYYQKIYGDLADSLLSAIEILNEKKEKQLVDMALPSSYHGLPTASDYQLLKNKGWHFI